MEFPLFMELDKGISLKPAGRINVLAVNTFSPEKEEAIKFIEQLSLKLPPLTKLMLMDVPVNSVENPEYENIIKDYNEQTLELKNKIQNAADIEKRELEDKLLKRIEELPQRKLQIYFNGGRSGTREKSIFKCGFLDLQEMYMLDPNIISLFKQYIGGKLSQELFIEKADNVVRLATYENK
ncbi:MAG: hypothetical protein ACOYIT_05285 [Christensenellales bacterium]|jgi:hypothetical protein